MSYRIGTLLRLAALSLPALSGCAGIYVEGQAAVYPSASYSATGTGASAAPSPAISGSSHAVGIALGFDFDFSRKSRFALGYTSVPTSVGGGGKISAGSSDARFDLKLAELGETTRIRLAFGFGLGSADGTGFKDKSGATLADKKGSNAGTGYIGPAVSHYFGGHHELTAMVGAQYFLGPVPGGSVGGSGAVAKLTYTFFIGSSWPEVLFIEPMETDKNIMPLIEAGAQQVGCSGQASVIAENTAAVMNVECPDKGSVFFDQSSTLMMITCHGMSRANCHELSDAIVSKAAELVTSAAKAAAAATPAAPPGPPAGAPTPAPGAPPATPGSPTAPAAPPDAPPTSGTTP